MKKPHGHYCRTCGQYKANEKFSGRGHAAHICIACARRGNKPPEVVSEISFVDDDEPIMLLEEVPISPKKKRKPSKEKLIRSAQKKQAKQLLNRMLANGDKTVSEIQRAASDAYIPIEALRRAKGSLGVRVFSTEKGFVWSLPQRKSGKSPDTDASTLEG